MSLRLNTVISNLIGEQQVGFIKGRKISTIHREIDDLLCWQRLNNLPGIVLAVDFKQAFDSINMNMVVSSLTKFGFGENFMNWVKILNTDRKACVKNGGHISNFFPMTNGVRQGCPISPQLFILAVEILAAKIIQDSNIKGLKPNNEISSIKISQYADDTTFFLRDEQDLTKVLNTLNEFSIFSFLKLNLSKSFAMSTNRSAAEREEGPVKFLDEIKILGIYFSNSKSAAEIETNWNPKIDTVTRLLSKWSNRDLSIIGKIHLVKTFGLSQFIFLMQSIELPRHVLDTINRIFFRFIWRKKFTNKKAWEKIKRSVLCNSKFNGGLNMVDIVKMQSSILLSWAEALISKNHHKWSKIALLFFRNLGGLSVFESSVSLKNFKGLSQMQSPFWRSVLRVWLEESDNPADPNIYFEDPIFNNRHIKYNNSSLFLPSCLTRGIRLISDVILIEEGRLLTLREFSDKYGPHPRNVLDHFTISTAMTNILHLVQHKENTTIMFKEIEIGSIGRKLFYHFLMTEDNPLCERIWSRKYGVELTADHWGDIFKISETRLQTLNWKIMHNIYPTNILLQKIRIKQSQMCDFCTETDFIEHFLFNCQAVKRLWSNIEMDIELYLGFKLKLTEPMVLLGVTNIPEVPKRLRTKVNYIIVIGKLCVSKFKYGKKRSLMELYESECSLRKFWREIS